MDAAVIGARLLQAERDELLPILDGVRTRTPLDLDRTTVCDGWSVRDVVAHVAAALGAHAAGRLRDVSPSANQVGVEARRHVSLADLLSELDEAFKAAADSGRPDGIALGAWVHGGDVREGLTVPGAYLHSGLADALDLLSLRSAERGVPPVDVTLTDAADLGLAQTQIGLGDPAAEPTGWLRTDTAGLFRLAAARRPELDARELVGVDPERLVVFG